MGDRGDEVGLQFRQLQLVGHGANGEDEAEHQNAGDEQEHIDVDALARGEEPPVGVLRPLVELDEPGREVAAEGRVHGERALGRAIARQNRSPVPSPHDPIGRREIDLVLQGPAQKLVAQVAGIEEQSPAPALSAAAIEDRDEIRPSSAFQRVSVPSGPRPLRFATHARPQILSDRRLEEKEPLRPLPARGFLCSEGGDHVAIRPRRLSRRRARHQLGDRLPSPTSEEIELRSLQRPLPSDQTLVQLDVVVERLSGIARHQQQRAMFQARDRPQRDAGRGPDLAVVAIECLARGQRCIETPCLSLDPGDRDEGFTSQHGIRDRREGTLIAG